MKRAIAMLLTVGMVGGLMFMGLAGTAAAQDVSVDLGGDGGDGGDAVNIAEVNQQNNNAQEATAEASASSSNNDDGAADNNDDSDKHDDYKDDKHDDHQDDSDDHQDDSDDYQDDSDDNNDQNAGSTTVVSAVSQSQDVTQTNYADVDQSATGGDGGDGGAVDISLDLGFGDDDDNGMTDDMNGTSA